MILLFAGVHNVLCTCRLLFFHPASWFSDPPMMLCTHPVSCISLLDGFLGAQSLSIPPGQYIQLPSAPLQDKQHHCERPHMCSLVGVVSGAHTHKCRIACTHFVEVPPASVSPASPAGFLSPTLTLVLASAHSATHHLGERSQVMSRGFPVRRA